MHFKFHSAVFKVPYKLLVLELLTVSFRKHSTVLTATSSCAGAAAVSMTVLETDKSCSPVGGFV